MGRNDIEVANRGVDRGSRPRQLCYPRGTFSVISSPHQEGHRGSLGQAFASASLGIELTVKPAFGLALHGGFLTRLSRPLGSLDIFSRDCRPSETAYQPLSPSRGKKRCQRRAVLHCRLHRTLRSGFESSRLRSAPITASQRQAAVKVHGVFVSLRGSPACSPASGFTRFQAGTVGLSLIPSCKPPIKRQGITLP